MKEEAVDRTLWRPRFGGIYGSVVRQTECWLDQGNKCKFSGNLYCRVGLEYDTADAKSKIRSLLFYISIANIITKIMNSKMLITSTFIWAFT